MEVLKVATNSVSGHIKSLNEHADGGVTVLLNELDQVSTPPCREPRSCAPFAELTWHQHPLTSEIDLVRNHAVLHQH